MAAAATPSTDIVGDVLKELTVALEPFDSVEGIELADRPRCTAADISAWERHAPVRLPNDLKAFLQTSSDGFELRWRVKHGDSLMPLGFMHIAGLEQMKPVPAAAFVDEMGRTRSALPAQENEPIRAIELDASTPHGRVCLVYLRSDPAQAQVWFQDVSCTWSFIANTFLDYFRLMVLHLGLPRWHYAYTSVGLDGIASSWIRFFAPERLALNKDQRADISRREARAETLRRVAASLSETPEDGDSPLAPKAVTALQRVESPSPKRPGSSNRKMRTRK